jgi:hypothetical protein
MGLTKRRPTAAPYVPAQQQRSYATPNQSCLQVTKIKIASIDRPRRFKTARFDEHLKRLAPECSHLTMQDEPESDQSATHIERIDHTLHEAPQEHGTNPPGERPGTIGSLSADTQILAQEEQLDRVEGML